MEHELFQYKLKHLVDRDLISDIIESCSSGGHPHRAAAVELILGRSIQDRHERVSTKVENASQLDPAPRVVGVAEVASITPIPMVMPPAPAPAPASQPKRSTKTAIKPVPNLNHPAPTPSSQPPLRPVPSSIPSGSIWESWGHQKSSTKLIDPTASAVRPEEPPVNAKIKSFPSEATVELVCKGCNVKLPRSDLWSNVYCPSCSASSRMRCVGCGATRAENTRTCAGCRRNFRW